MAPRRSKLHIPRLSEQSPLHGKSPSGLPHYVSLLLLSPKAIDQLLGAPYWESSLIPLLLLSNRDPLRWARGWGRPAAASLRWEGKFHGPFRRQGPLREKLVPNSVVDSCHASPVRDAVLSPPIPQKLSGPLGLPAFAPLRSSPAAHNGSALLYYLERQVMRPRVRS